VVDGAGAESVCNSHTVTGTTLFEEEEGEV